MSCFFFVNLARGLSFSLIFSKKLLLDFIAFSSSFFFSCFQLHWFLLFIISWFLLPLGLFCSSFYSFLSGRLDYCFETFLLFLHKHFNAISLPLSTALAAPHKFRYVVPPFSFSSKSFLISLESSSLTHGLLRNLLLSCQVFRDFPHILLLLISSLMPL